jgi:hypothetical protein
MIPTSSRTPTGEHPVGAGEAVASSVSQATPVPAQVPIACALVPARGEE